MKLFLSKYKYDAFYIGVIFILSTDRLLKNASFFFSDNDTNLVPGLLGFRFGMNQAVAFSLKIFNTRSLPFIIMLLTTLLLLYFSTLYKNNQKVPSVLIFMIIIGSMGNLYDRITYGSVIDYLYLNHLFIFNLSDALIVVGSLGFIFHYLKNDTVLL
jgi:signal peptidase II